MDEFAAQRFLRGLRAAFRGTAESIFALRCAKIIKPCHGSILQHGGAFIVARRAGHQVRYRVTKEHRRFLHAARNHCGISARIDRTLLKDAKRAAGWWPHESDEAGDVRHRDLLRPRRNTRQPSNPASRYFSRSALKPAAHCA